MSSTAGILQSSMRRVCYISVQPVGCTAHLHIIHTLITLIIKQCSRWKRGKKQLQINSVGVCPESSVSAVSQDEQMLAWIQQCVTHTAEQHVINMAESFTHTHTQQCVSRVEYKHNVSYKFVHSSKRFFSGELKFDLVRKRLPSD